VIVAGLPPSRLQKDVVPILRLLSLLVFFGAPAFAATHYPAPQNIARPDPEPALPTTFDTFEPPTGQIPTAVAAPEIAEWTRIGGPGNAIALTGSQLSLPEGHGGIDTQFRVFGQGKGAPVLISVPPRCIDGMKAVFVLPPSLPANSEYLIWPVNSAGAGYPIAVNATEAWWLGPDTATHGETVSVFGRNLAHNSTTGGSSIYIQKAGEVGTWATVTAVNPYRVDFTVPDALANGQYLVWTHNGRGGHYGWSGPLTLNVVDETPWTQQIFNVKDYGAKGDGATDDEAAIQSAMQAAASAPWSTIYLPTGTYMVSRGFTPPSKVRWKGDGPAKTFLKASAGFVKPAAYDSRRYSLFCNEGELNHLTFQDLTIDANGNMNGYLPTPIHLRSVSDLCFENVTIAAKGYGTADFHADTHLKLKNCNLIGSGNGVFFGAARQVMIDGCNVYGTDDTNTMLTFWGATEVSCTNTTGQDFDPTRADGWAQGRFFYGSSQWGSNRDIYVGSCTTHHLAVRPGFPNSNSGEQMSWESGTRFSATPIDATNTTVTFSAAPFLNAPNLPGGRYDAVIASGAGLGQHRKIIGCSGTTITVSPPWNVPPDTSSIVLIGGILSDCVIYRNSLQGKSDYATRVSASAGIQPFGNSYDFIADGNTISQTCNAIYLWSMSQIDMSPQSIDCVYFNYIANNTINHCLNGIVGVSNAWSGWPPRDPYPGITYLANTCINNRIDSDTTTGFVEYALTAPPRVQVDINVFDHNVVTNTPTAMKIKGSDRQVRNNVFLPDN
jgi:hypothetical protein